MATALLHQRGHSPGSFASCPSLGLELNSTKMCVTPTGVPSVFPQTRPSSLLFPTRGRSCHLVSSQAASSLAFLASFLPASPSRFTSASYHCFRLFTFHNPIHSEPGCCTRQPRIRVGCAPGLPWIRVLPKSLETTIPRMPCYPVTYWKIKSLPSAAGALCIC